MTFGAEEVTNVALQALTMAKKNRDKSYEQSNMTYMFNKSLDESENPFINSKSFNRRSNVWNRRSAICILWIPHSIFQYFCQRFPVEQGGKLCHWWKRGEVNGYIDSCIAREVDPVLHFAWHLNRSAIIMYSEDEIWRTFQKIADCLKTTDVEKRGKFEDLSKYISQLRNKVFTISLFGEVNSGKSTIINCIIGLEVAHTFLAICMALQSFMKMINTKKFQSWRWATTSSKMDLTELMKVQRYCQYWLPSKKCQESGRTTWITTIGRLSKYVSETLFAVLGSSILPESQNKVRSSWITRN